MTDQYDRFVRGNTVLAQPEDAGLIRIDEETGLGVALATDCNSRFSFLNPYWGAQLSLLEAYRNVVVAGAEPVAVTDCLNFGSPEDPTVMWQFREAVLGLVDGCRALGIPVTGGNVSFYNQTGDVAILPTPTVGVMGVIDDVSRRVRSSFAYEGDAVVLLGTTDDDLSGSAWADVIHDHHLGGRPPRVDFDHHVRLCSLFQAATKEGLLSSAHDLSDGGLAMALVESCLRRNLGVALTLPDGDPTVQLFSETAGRVPGWERSRPRRRSRSRTSSRCPSTRCGRRGRRRSRAPSTWPEKPQRLSPGTAPVPPVRAQGSWTSGDQAIRRWTIGSTSANSASSASISKASGVPNTAAASGVISSQAWPDAVQDSRASMPMSGS